MLTLNNVHQQFAAYFRNGRIQPFAYLLSRKLSEGHICVPLHEAVNEQDAIALFGKTHLTEAAQQLPNEPMVATRPNERQPFVLHNGKLYLQRYFFYETVILQRITQLIGHEQTTLAARMQALNERRQLLRVLFAEGEKETTTHWQMVAAIMAVLNNFTIITGGPGTGKTTTVAKMLSLICNMTPSTRIALAAPTGKAATRMAESIQAAIAAQTNAGQTLPELIPATLHRLLGLKPGSTNSSYNADKPLDYDLIIVDESSMIDVSLFAKLMQAIGPDTRLILLGDKDQLASVEAGSLFGDLCKAQSSLNQFSPAIATFINSLQGNSSTGIAPDAITDNHTHILFQHVVELRKSRRFSDSEGIGKFSKAIIGNQSAVIQQYLQPEFDQQVIIDSTHSEHVFASFVSGYKAYIHEKDTATAIHLFNRQRVLCAVRMGPHGLTAINKKIEQLLYASNSIQPNDTFYENRPVIITRNYYDLQLFNGDIGLIRRDENGIMKAWFLDSSQQLRGILPGLIAESETVFAMTIHKSQGSEFDEVLVVLPDDADMALLTRELLYTAVTRARRKATIQGSHEVIINTAAQSVHRISGIVERFGEQD